ncbi:hypothetical protein [Mycetocola sp. 2940]|uniref:hypothetical protein n=1 Tax=Mycetocola sp. 2940 TaxID=3156452 RepID=UPI003396A05E
MNDDTEFDPVERLRAADPADDLEPRAGFAENVVAQATGRVADPAVDPTVESAPVADLAATRAHRRWIAVAAVAASIVIVGAAGYGLGFTTSGTNLADGEAAPPISLQSGNGTAETGQESAAGGADQRTTDAIYPTGYGRNSFSANGLGTQETSAQAYAFDARAASNSAAIPALATALGITSPVEFTNGAWTAGPEDGSAPNLFVSVDGALSFYFHDPRINPWRCDDVGTCQPSGEPPTEDVAIGALRSLLVAAGRDPGAFQFTSHVWEGSPTRTAEARMVVNGQQIDQPWSMEVSEGGVVSAYGALAEVVGLGEYAVVSEREGFERLSDPRFGAAPTILPVAEGAAGTGTEWVPPTEPPATPSPGESVSWPVKEVQIVSARLGLASQWQPDGSVLVVPAYEFSDTDGGVWSVIAVADSMLDFESD